MRTRSLLLSASLLVSACAEEKPAPAATSGAPAATSARPAPSASASGAPAGSSSGAAPAPAAEAPKDLNVIVLMVDSLRVDRMPASNYAREVMPNIAKFEQGAVSYTQAYSLSCYTAMTFAGFLGAKYPSELPRNGSFFSNTADEADMFPELLQKAGVRTLAGHAHWYFQKGRSGLEQGFDVWEVVEGIKKSNTTDENITSPKHLELAMKQLGDQANTKGRFFAFYYFLDPHDQYMGHEEKKFGRKAEDLYDGEIFYTDLHIGKLLDWIDQQPWGKRTAVVISGDHGETFGEHGMYRHGHELWQELVRVPMMIRMPGAKPRRIDVPRSHVDLAPTIMDWMGVKGPAGMQGKSLVPELLGGDAPERPVIADLPRTGDSDRRRALISGTKKIISFGDDDSFKVFDVKADPKEKDDLAEKDKATLEEMKKKYEEASKEIRDVCPKAVDKLKGKKKGKKC